MALSEFRRLSPTISLLDPEISIRFENSSELHNPWLRGWKFPVPRKIFPDTSLEILCSVAKGIRL